MKNIPENTPSEQLKELFERHGEVKKVVMPPSKSGGKGDFGFIHFAERSSALKAVNDTEKYEINGMIQANSSNFGCNLKNKMLANSTESKSIDKNYGLVCYALRIELASLAEHKSRSFGL